MLFAAGFGTRMGALTATQPKPMIPVAGKPLIDHALEHVTDHGLERIVVNLHYLPDQITTHLDGRNIAFSLESPDILETGGGLRAALPQLGPGPVFTMNTDAVWSGPNPLRLLSAQWDPAKMDALLVTIAPENAIGHSGKGDFIADADGCAQRGPGAIYSGLQIIKTEGLANIPDTAFSLNLLWNKMIDEGRLFTLPYPGRWCDVGRPEGIDLAEKMLRDDAV